MQPLPDVREICVRRDLSLITNLGTCFETPDSMLQSGTIDHPPNKDDERRNKRGQEPPGNGRSEDSAIDERKKSKHSPKAGQRNPGCRHHSSPIPANAVLRMSAPHLDSLAFGNHYNPGIAHGEALRILFEVIA